MLVNRLKSALIATASAGALLAGVSPASAAVIPFTWSPFAAVAPLGAASNLNITNATTITAQDWATFYLPGSCFMPGGCGANSVIEKGFLVFSSFPDSTTGDTGLTNAGGSVSNGGSPYMLFIAFNAKGQAAPGPGGPGGDSLVGFFNSLDYSLVGQTPADLNGPTGGMGAQFCLQDSTLTCNNLLGGTVPTDLSGNTPRDVLAVGALAGPKNTASIATDGTPHADASATFKPCTGAGTPAGGATFPIVEACTTSEAGFFISPTVFMNIDLFSSFTNSGNFTAYLNDGIHNTAFDCNGTVLGLGDTCYTIHNGVANITFQTVDTPEPSTLGMFGLGLIGLGWFSRRREKAAIS